MTAGGPRPLRLFLIAGEESGDQLGAELMRALTRRIGAGGVAFEGVGGHAMAGEGLSLLFPASEIAVMGISAVIASLPGLVRRIFTAAAAIEAARPDGLVIIDSPDFTHAVARRVRRKLPALPIVNYVSPTVWAWRPGRAKRMRRYIDHVLALKPFEPEAHRRLGGPPCTYVGHPLIQRLPQLRAEARESPDPGRPLRLVVLPGSRRIELARLMDTFAAAVERVARAVPRPLELALPAVAHLADEIETAVARWPVRPQVVRGEAAKFAAFRRADAALAASGTVTLELALAGVPMVVAYKVSKIEEQLRHFITVPSIVLVNLILGDKVVPELLQWHCTPETLSAALLPLLQDGPERRRQTEAFARLDRLMSIGDETPSERAARIVLEVIEAAIRRPAAAA